MTNLEIFDNSVFKAEENNYLADSILYAPLYKSIGEEEALEVRVNKIIFSHSFAKAFWGEEEIADSNGKTMEEFFNQEKEYFIDIEAFEWEWGGEDIPTSYAWEYHLRKMVTKEEPLKYLEKFL